ncbi:glycoside hydrolase family 3 protein [Deinococcus wulumuqiensis]|uniref:glycoside hydrolase family 3 protein n=1 Tax=Deinococcus wulumuqiensis TaxID=980427 RepID=UPI00242E2F00|nr:glycoside hydrolase family 3 protein [Deinococcus wulumuqiensis]
MSSFLTAEQNAFVADLLSHMTLAEKIGQMTQIEKNSVKPGDLARLGIGSVLSGGGGNPEPNNPQTWRAMVSAFIDDSLESRLRIPLIYGSDAVHGHNNVYGATIFPHNIGLGCTRDPDLLRRIGRATALEACATDVRWTFAPAVSLPQDVRWGRSYEGYGQTPDIVTPLAAALVEGLRGDGWNSRTSVLPSVKHFIADGATTWGTSTRVKPGEEDNPEDRTLQLAQMPEDRRTLALRGAWQIDQGDARIDEQTLREVHLPPYQAALAAGALNVMASYSMWQGKRMHEHHHLLTEVLKGELGFEGFIVSDWEAIDKLHVDFDVCVENSINAGIDMLMVPFEYERFITTLTRLVEAGRVTQERIDDAVRRILAVKVLLGLFEHPHTDPALLEVVGCAEHHALAREAAQKSCVLLKNDSGVLPLTPNEPILVAGPWADDIGLQCGGWTVSWMGGSGPTVPGTTVLDGLRENLGASNVHYEPEADGAGRYALGVVVLTEENYSEGTGDRHTLQLTEAHRRVLARARARCERLVVVLLCGRPQVITDELPDWDALLVGFLPGSEGAGVADVLTGRVPATGQLSFDWPRQMTDLNRAEAKEWLFRIGDGLGTAGGR